VVGPHRQVVAYLDQEEVGSLVVVHHTQVVEDHNHEVVADRSRLVVGDHSLEVAVHSQQVVVHSPAAVVHILVEVDRSQLAVEVRNQLVVGHSQVVGGGEGSLLVEVDHILEVEDHSHPDEVEVPDVVVVRMAYNQLVVHVEVVQLVVIDGHTQVLLVVVDNLLVVVHIRWEVAHVA
jgi:hypothetical protein